MFLYPREAKNIFTLCSKISQFFQNRGNPYIFELRHPNFFPQTVREPCETKQTRAEVSGHQNENLAEMVHRKFFTIFLQIFL